MRARETAKALQRRKVTVWDQGFYVGPTRVARIGPSIWRRIIQVQPVSLFQLRQMGRTHFYNLMNWTIVLVSPLASYEIQLNVGSYDLTVIINDHAFVQFHFVFGT